jgi:hypothetical protein
MILRKLSLLKNFKAYALGVSIIALAAFSAYNYTVYLNNKIDALVTDRETLTQIITRYEITTKQLESVMNENNKLLLNEISYLNTSFTKYESMLSDNRRSVDELSKYMSEMQNEQIQVCFNTELPTDLVDRLFNKTRPETD